MDRIVDLRSDYDRLGQLLGLLTKDDASAAAAIARERRLIGELLETLEKPTEVSLVDKLAANVTALESRRGTAADAARPASRRRKSG